MSGPPPAAGRVRAPGGPGRFAGVDERVREDRDWLAAYRGLSPEQVRRRARDEGRPLRVLHPGSVVTMDFRPDRLNLHLDEHGEPLDVTAG